MNKIEHELKELQEEVKLIKKVMGLSCLTMDRKLKPQFVRDFKELSDMVCKNLCLTKRDIFNGSRKREIVRGKIFLTMLLKAKGYGESQVEAVIRMLKETDGRYCYKGFDRSTLYKNVQNYRDSVASNKWERELFRNELLSLPVPAELKNIVLKNILPKKKEQFNTE